MDLFRGNTPNGDQIRQIKHWVSECFEVQAEETVMVSELRCTEPGCPPLETIIAILSSAERRQFQLHKPVAEIQRSDIEGLKSQ
jgi:hypothetical protein